MTVAAAAESKMIRDLKDRLAALDGEWAEVVAEFEYGTDRRHRAAGFERPAPIGASDVVHRLGEVAAKIRATEARLTALGEAVEAADLAERAWSDLRGPREREVETYLCRAWETTATKAIAVRDSESSRVARLKAAYAAGQIPLDRLDRDCPKAEAARADAVRRLEAIGFAPDLEAKQAAAAMGRFGGPGAVSALAKAARIGLGEHEEATTAYAEARGLEAEAARLEATLKRLDPAAPLAVHLKAKAAPMKARAKQADAQAAKDADACVVRMVDSAAIGDPGAVEKLRDLAARIPEAFPDGFRDAMGEGLTLDEAQLKGTLAVAMNL